MLLAIVNRAVGKGGKIEIATQFAVDPMQHIEVEPRGNARFIVIGLVQHAFVLFEIDANDHTGIMAQNIARAAQECAGFMRLEISERRSWKKPDLWHCSDRLRQRERRGKIRRNRIDGETGKVLP